MVPMSEITPIEVLGHLDTAGAEVERLENLLHDARKLRDEWVRNAIEKGYKLREVGPPARLSPEGVRIAIRREH